MDINKLIEEKADNKFNCHNVVRRALESRNIKVSKLGMMCNTDFIHNIQVLAYQIYEDYKEMCNEAGTKRQFEKQDVLLEFEAIKDAMWRSDRELLRAELHPSQNPARFDELLTLIAEALLNSDNSEDLVLRRAKAFVAHFVWQVMMKLHVGHESVRKGGNEAILLLVSPKQKTGKSTATKLLLKPFLDKGFVWRASLDRLEDSFSLSNLATNYIALFDDMHSTAKLQTGKFKALITDSEVSYRQIFTAHEMTVPKLVTLIGTSNQSPREVLADTTGLRRFHVIDVANEDIYTGRGIDLETLNSININELYTSCPLTEVSPLFTYLSATELREYEEEIRPQHSVEQFIEDREYSPEGETFIGSKELYTQFRIWASSAGISQNSIPTLKTFTLKMAELRFRKSRTANQRGFLV